MRKNASRLFLHSFKIFLKRVKYALPPYALLNPGRDQHQGTGKSDARTRAHSQSCAKQSRQDQVALQIASHRIADHSGITVAAPVWDAVWASARIAAWASALAWR